MIIARSFWTVKAGAGVLREEPLPSPGPGQCLVRALASGVSRGTEALVFRGGVPPSQYRAMRAPLMDGAFPFPVKYGYSLVGETEGGQRVFVLHPHQDVCVVPQVMCIPVPDGVPTSRAVLAANLETAVNLAWDAAPLVGERVSVIGAGVVGLLVASLLARTPATRVTVIDTNAGRAKVVCALGCSFATPATAPTDQELIVHTSATESGLLLALRSAAYEARIVEASWFGDATIAVPFGEAFHAKRLRILASQVGGIAPLMRGRRTYTERLAVALDMLTNSAYDSLLEGPSWFQDLPGAMSGILRPGGLCHVVKYRSQ